MVSIKFRNGKVISSTTLTDAKALAFDYICSENYQVIMDTYTVKKGDTLMSIASQVYGDAYAWPKIYALNRDRIPDPHTISIDQVLRLI